MRRISGPVLLISTLAIAAGACGPDDEHDELPLVVDAAPAEHAPRAEDVPLRAPEPHAVDEEEPAAAAAAASEDVLPTDWLPPVVGRITSRFGEPRDGALHDAIDIAAPMGAEVRAPVDLRVRLNAYKTRAGRFLVADAVSDDDGATGDGFRILFAHLSHTDVFEGQLVKKGERLGLIGLSGSATGPHVHLRVERVTTTPDGLTREAIDPLLILREAEITGSEP